MIPQATALALLHKIPGSVFLSLIVANAANTSLQTIYLTFCGSVLCFRFLIAPLWKSCTRSSTCCSLFCFDCSLSGRSSARCRPRTPLRPETFYVLALLCNIVNKSSIGKFLAISQDKLDKPKLGKGLYDLRYSIFSTIETRIAWTLHTLFSA